MIPLVSMQFLLNKFLSYSYISKIFRVIIIIASLCISNLSIRCCNFQNTRGVSILRMIHCNPLSCNLFRYLKNVSVEGEQGKPNVEFTQDGVLKAAELKIMNLRPGVSKQLVWEEVSPNYFACTLPVAKLYPPKPIAASRSRARRRRSVVARSQINT